MIKVLFFASFREKLKCGELLVDDDSYPELISSLKNQLAEKGDDWREIMMREKTLVAVNQIMTRKDVSLKSGDEVAFFPPVTGG